MRPSFALATHCSCSPTGSPRPSTRTMKSSAPPASKPRSMRAAGALPPTWSVVSSRQQSNSLGVPSSRTTFPASPSASVPSSRSGPGLFEDEAIVAIAAPVLDPIGHAAHQQDAEAARLALFDRPRQLRIGAGQRIEWVAVVDHLGDDSFDGNVEPHPNHMRWRQVGEGVVDHVRDRLLENERHFEGDVVGKPVLAAAALDPFDKRRNCRDIWLDGNFVRGHVRLLPRDWRAANPDPNAIAARAGG